MSGSDSINRAALSDLLEATGNDPAFLAELIDTYLADSVALITAMQQAISGARTDDLRRAAHSLKSNSASLGARSLADLCQALEYQARDGILEGASERLVAIEAAYAAAERELRALRPTV